MQWLLTAHVRRYHQHYHSSGHVWQGRFKAFPIQEDEHLLTVLRCVERNAMRAELVRRVERWRWSSVAARPADPRAAFLHDGPVPRPKNWLTAGELARVRHSVVRGTPFGETTWIERAARRLGLESTLRPRGRPPKETEK